MEQSDQQIAQKPVLPRKTKIVTIVLTLQGIGISVLGIDLLGVYLSSVPKHGHSTFHIFIIIFLIIYGIFFSIVSFFLFRRKTLAWYGALCFLLMSSMGGGFLTFFFFMVTAATGYQGAGLRDYLLFFFLPAFSVWSLIAFILLLLDRKNFFKVTS